MARPELDAGHCADGLGLRAFAGTLPLTETEAPNRAEEDDRRHVQRPGTELVVAHLGLAHRVEEELKIPDDSGKGGEEVVEHQWDLTGALSSLCYLK